MAEGRELQRIGTDILALESLQTVGSSVPALYKHI